MKKIALAVLAFAFVGCATPQQRAEQAMRNHGPFCTAMGMKQGSPEWSNCVVQRQASDDALTTAIVFGR